MSTITTRAGKGSPLTNEELDSNFTNLNDDKIENVVEDTTPQLGGDLDVNGHLVAGRNIATDGTKLDGIEAGADVTDTANVTAAGALMTTGGSVTGDITFGDNNKAIFGAGSDLQIYHDSNNSVIQDAGTGDLYIQGDNILRLTNVGASEHYAKFNQNGAVQLYYDNEVKLATTSTGIDVTGTATMDGLVSSAASEIFSNAFSGGETPALRLTNTSEGVGTTATLELIAGSTNSANNTRKAVIENVSTTGSGSSLQFYTTPDGTNLYRRLHLQNNGDISFYDDSGAAKFFWDASAESLAIGTTSDKFSVYDGAYTIKKDGSNKIFVGNTADALGSGTGMINYLYDAEPFIWWQGTERMRIDSSGNLLVGTTSANNTTDGVRLKPDGFISVANTSGPVMYANRLSSDGTIFDLQKDGTTVGSIGVAFSDNVYISGNSSHSGLGFGSNTIYPSTTTGAGNDNDISLGDSTTRFKDLYLSGGVYLGGTGSANHLDDYEEGAWTPTDESGAGLAFAGKSGTYTKVGNTVFISMYLQFPATSDTTSVLIGGLPFATAADTGKRTGMLPYYNTGTNAQSLLVNISDTKMRMKAGSDQASNMTNNQMSGATTYWEGSYRI